MENNPITKQLNTLRRKRGLEGFSGLLSQTWKAIIEQVHLFSTSSTLPLDMPCIISNNQWQLWCPTTTAELSRCGTDQPNMLRRQTQRLAWERKIDRFYLFTRLHFLSFMKAMTDLVPWHSWPHCPRQTMKKIVFIESNRCAFVGHGVPQLSEELTEFLAKAKEVRAFLCRELEVLLFQDTSCSSRLGGPRLWWGSAVCRFPERISWAWLWRWWVAWTCGDHGENTKTHKFLA